MKALVTFLSIFISTAIFSQGLNCLDNLTIGIHGQDEVQLFADDVLVETDNINRENYVISIDTMTASSVINLTEADIGSHSFKVTNTATSASCEGTIIVEESIPSTVIAVCTDKIILDLGVETTVTIDDIEDGSFSEGTSELIFSLSLGESELNKPGDPNFEIANTIDFKGLDVCPPPHPVYLNVWDNEGNHNACRTTVFINVPGLDCTHDFSEANGNSFASIVCEAFVTFIYSDTNKSISLEQIDGGSNLDAENSTVSLSFEHIPASSPADTDFVAVETLTFSDDDVCEIVNVFMHVWNEKGELSSCWSHVQVQGAEDCDFNHTTGCGGEECDGELTLDPYSIKWPITYDDTSLKSYQLDCKGLSEKELETPARPECNNDSESGVPTWCELDCGLVGYSYEDVIWDEQASCSDVARLWTIVDWCTFDPNSTDTETNNDSYGLIEDIRDDQCDSCNKSSDLYVGYVQVEADGYYTYEQIIKYSDSSNTNLSQVPVVIDQISGSFDMAAFGFEINGSSLQLNENGTFMIPESAIQEGTNVLSLKTLPESNVLDGVSTLDIVLGLQYVIGLRELTPQQIIAADMDKSGDVSVARDLIKLRNLILGNATDIQGEDWFIVEQNQDFSSFNGYDFENSYSSYIFEKEDLDMAQGLTIAIHKYGDLNNSHSYSRSNEKAFLQFENKNINKGDELIVTLNLSSDKIGQFIAAQAGIVFQDLVLTDVKHAYGNEFGYNNESDKFKFVYNDNNNPLSELEVELGFTAKSSGELSDFIKLDDDFITEYITPRLELYEIELIHSEVDLPNDPIGQFNPILSDVSIFPNPTSSSFTIQVELNKIGKTLNIYNSMGQVEYTQKVKSVNTIINSNSLSAGLKIVSVDGSQSQKLIINK